VVLGLFEQCYARQFVGLAGVPVWQRVALPAGGGVSTQDAWLIAALEYVQQVRNAMELEARKSSQPRKPRGKR
jgi:hypothetical protein